MYAKMIGKKSGKVINVVERGEVKKFAEAIGDPHPIYIDREYASQTKYVINIAPPTFPIVFKYGNIEGISLPDAGLIHGEQSFEYNRPLIIGDEVHCFSEIEDYYEKQGGSGKMAFLIRRDCGEDPLGNEIFSCRTIIIIMEAVRKEIQNA